MVTRRDFLAQSAAAGVLATSARSALALTKHPRVRGLIRRDETTLRLGGLVGFGFPMTWAADGSQFVSFLDGFGVAKPPIRKNFHGRLATVFGDPPNPVFEDIPGYPDFLGVVPEADVASLYGGGCLALDGCVYHFLSTTDNPWLRPDNSFSPKFDWIGARLIYSPDNGITWRNQNGSTPVVQEKWNARSRENAVFLNEEPEGAFSLLSFLQMGRNYELNRDGYVYVYSPNGHSDGTMNELVMFRVPKSRILDRHSYEFFSGARSNGTATWTRDISARAAVHTFPRGWVNRHVPGETAWAWAPSVTYNAPLGVYMMTSWGTGVGTDGGWFAKPSYLGVWVARSPWGPFTQIHEELAWTPDSDAKARAWYPQIAPKWISADGKSFWLVWSDGQYDGVRGQTEHPDQGIMDLAKHVTDPAEFARLYGEWLPKVARYCLFNVQRVDLIVT
jgi:hypothetical protein